MMSLRASIRSTANLAQRAFSVNAPACTTADPIQGLFVDKIREYGEKKSAAGGKMVDATAATEAELQNELEKVQFFPFRDQTSVCLSFRSPRHTEVELVSTCVLSLNLLLENQLSTPSILELRIL